MRPRRSRPHTLLVALLLAGFTLVLEVSPAFHHDFDCHLRSPSHCPACLASPAALSGETGHSLGVALVEVTAAHSDPGLPVPQSPSLTSLKDRSPPA